MSIRWDADRNLDSARDSVQRAVESLNGIVIGTDMGADEFSKEFLIKVEEAHSLLLEIKRKLK